MPRGWQLSGAAVMCRAEAKAAQAKADTVALAKQALAAKVCLFLCDVPQKAHFVAVEPMHAQMSCHWVRADGSFMRQYWRVLPVNAP